MDGLKTIAEILSEILKELQSINKSILEGYNPTP